MTWKIQAITGELTGQEISIDRDMLVGRHQTADILLQQSEISRKHAAFLLKEHALWLQDLGSSNGTYVNNVQIAAETLLKQGDIVQFASLKFSVFEPVPLILSNNPIISSA
jgi:pSer/pThr/pTyr-binding forkhead associated (FHA) protein